MSRYTHIENKRLKSLSHHIIILPMSLRHERMTLSFPYIICHQEPNLKDMLHVTLHGTSEGTHIYTACGHKKLPT